MNTALKITLAITAMGMLLTALASRSIPTPPPAVAQTRFDVTWDEIETLAKADRERLPPPVTKAAVIEIEEPAPLVVPKTMPPIIVAAPERPRKVTANWCEKHGMTKVFHHHHWWCRKSRA